ncbi:MAG TPA: carotenoid oxygenase family protein [Rhizomicrobium sp.]|nr:carotenoid oxygenase family protein [Rhizomicrobium sp.]
MNAPVRSNPYLSGNFAPIATEDDFADLALEGSLPLDLHGALYRNGPNPQFPPRDDNYHWFLGDGMLHAFFIANGKVSYRNRYVRTPKWEVEHKAGKALFGSWGNPMTTDPSVMNHEGGTANTSILFHAGKLLALEEAHQPFAVDPKTLASKGYETYAGAARHFTAHPKIDPETGEMLFFGYGVGDVPLSAGMVYGVVDRNGRVTRRDLFEAPFASMVHDFIATKNHVLFPILPLTLSLERAMGGLPPVAWEPDKGSRVGVMARDKGIGSIRWFTTDANYVFHVMNAFEDGSRLVADVMEYPNAPLFPNADGSPGAAARAVLKRWTFDLAAATNTIRRETLDDRTGEFPRFDERRAGLAYRHGWFAARSTDDADVRFDAIAHIDLSTGRRSQFLLPPGDVTSEPVFVARSHEAAEGDGWLLAVVYRARENTSDLLVLNAQAVEKGPVATAKLPRRVPFGFHGCWLGTPQ